MGSSIALLVVDITTVIFVGIGNEVFTVVTLLIPERGFSLVQDRAIIRRNQSCVDSISVEEGVGSQDGPTESRAKTTATRKVVNKELPYTTQR